MAAETSPGQSLRRRSSPAGDCRNAICSGDNDMGGIPTYSPAIDKANFCVNDCCGWLRRSRVY